VVKNKARALAHYYVANALDPKGSDKDIAGLEKLCTASQLEKAENIAEGLWEQVDLDKE